MYINEGKEQIIISIDLSQNRIKLIDGSEWEVESINSFKLPLWLATNRAIVKKSFMDYDITNTNRNETLKFKKV